MENKKLIGYARVSKADDSQKHDLQIDALVGAGVDQDDIYTDRISGAKSDRPGLSACLKALRPDDMLVVWSLDRLGRNLRHLVNLVNTLMQKGVGLKILSGAGAAIDTSTPHGRMFFHFFAALSEFERELIRERTIAGLKAARARGHSGGRKLKLSKNKVRYASELMGKKDTVVAALAKELNVTKATLYRYVAPDGSLRPAGEKVLGK